MINSADFKPLLNMSNITDDYLNYFNEQQIDKILDGLEKYGFAIIDDVHGDEFLNDLRQQCTQHQKQFRQAEIQNGKMTDIRSDHILWIDDQLPIAQRHLAYLLGLGKAINQAFYLGIDEIEGHFAHYHAGEFYKLHRDNPHNKNGRLISTVFYLHEHWKNGDGGELRLQDKRKQWHIIQPRPNRLAIFQSDLLHEVLLSHQDRLSITAWLRQRSV